MAQDIRFPRLNSVMISGHLTREVEMRYTPKGVPIARMGLAVNRNYKNAEGDWVDEASFIDIKSFGKQAEDCAQRLHKGSPVIVEGYLNTYTFTNKENQQIKITEITATKIHFLEKQYPSETDIQHEQTRDSFENKEQSNITDDDVPF